MRLIRTQQFQTTTTQPTASSENTQQQSMSNGRLRLARKQTAKRLEPLRRFGIEPHGRFTPFKTVLSKIKDGKPAPQKFNCRKVIISKHSCFGIKPPPLDFSGIDLRNQPLNGMKLKWDSYIIDDTFSFDFSHGDFTGADLSDTEFVDSYLYNTNFTGANLSRAKLSHSVIGPQTCFRNVNFTNAIFFNIKYVRNDEKSRREYEYFDEDTFGISVIDLTGANFTNVIRSKDNKSSLFNDFFDLPMYINVNVEGATFTPYYERDSTYRKWFKRHPFFPFNLDKIHNKSLKNVTIHGLDLSKENFNRFNFSGATLQNIKMVGTNFNNTTFDNATITLDFSDLTSFDGLDLALNHINNPEGTLLTAIDSIPTQYNELKINLMRQVIEFLNITYNERNLNKYNQLCSHYPAIIQIIDKPPYNQDPLIQEYISTKIVPHLIELFNSSSLLNRAQSNSLFEYAVPHLCDQLNQSDSLNYFQKNNGSINQLLMALKQTISAMTIQLQWHHHHQRSNPQSYKVRQASQINSKSIKNKDLLHKLITALANAIPPNVHQPICNCAVMDDTIVDLLRNSNTALFPITWNQPNESAFVLICPNAICRMLNQTATDDDFKNIIVVCKTNGEESNFDYMPPDTLKTNLTLIYKQIPLLNLAFQQFQSSFMFPKFIHLLGFSESITQLFIDASKTPSLPNEQKLFGSSITNGRRMQHNSGKQIEAAITNALKSTLCDACNGNIAEELQFIDTPIQSLQPDAFDPPLTTKQIASAKNNLRGIQVSDTHSNKILDCCQANDATQNEKAIILLCIATVMSKYSSSLLFGTEISSPQALRNYTLALINTAVRIAPEIISNNTHQQWQSVLLGEAFSCTAILTNDMKTTLIHDNQHKAIAEKWFNQLYPMAW